jgi:hypothetical protein
VVLDCFSLNESCVVLCCVMICYVLLLVVIYLKSGREASIYTLTPGILEASTRFC